MKTFRMGATTLPFLLWTVFLLVLGAFLGDMALTPLRGDPKSKYYLAFTFLCLLLGPIGFMVHLLRLWLVYVAVDPERGILLSGRRWVKWEEIRAFEFHPGFFRPDETLFRIFIDMITLRRRSTEDEIEFLTRLILAPFIALFWLAAIMPFAVLFPVLFMLSPWHRRVVIHLRDGPRLIYRDMSGDVEFVRLISARIARQGQGTPPENR